MLFFFFKGHIFNNVHCLCRLIPLLPMKNSSISRKETLLCFYFLPLLLLTHYKIVVTAI